MKIALVYPWPSQPEVFRAVLIRGVDEERRLAEALPRFEKGENETDKRGVYGEASRTSLEAWLRQENFKPIDVTELRLGKHDGMFKAPKPTATPAQTARPIEMGELKLERDLADVTLELESQAQDAEPKLELESPAAARAA